MFDGFNDNLGSQTGLINFRPTRPRSEIAEEFIHLYNVLYDPEFYLNRTFEYLSRMELLPPKKAFSSSVHLGDEGFIHNTLSTGCALPIQIHVSGNPFLGVCSDFPRGSGIFFRLRCSGALLRIPPDNRERIRGSTVAMFLLWKP